MMDWYSYSPRPSLPKNDPNQIQIYFTNALYTWIKYMHVTKIIFHGRKPLLQSGFFVSYRTVTFQNSLRNLTGMLYMYMRNKQLIIMDNSHSTTIIELKNCQREVTMYLLLYYSDLLLMRLLISKQMEMMSFPSSDRGRDDI